MGTALDLPENVNPRPAFDLQRDASFLEYERILRLHLNADITIECRFDPAFFWKDQKRYRVGEGEGFGKDKSADARLVIRKISDVHIWNTPLID